MNNEQLEPNVAYFFPNLAVQSTILKSFTNNIQNRVNDDFHRHYQFNSKRSNRSNRNIAFIRRLPNMSFGRVIKKKTKPKTIHICMSSGFTDEIFGFPLQKFN